MWPLSARAPSGAASIERGERDKRHKGISMFLVERNTPGFSVSRKLDKMGNRASDTAELAFQDMRVPAENLLGREGVGFYEVMRVFQRERLVASLIEAARALTYAACLRFQAGEDAVKEISMVKLFAGEMAQRVAYDCVQLHGGYGYMREYPIERFFRDIRLLTIGGGTSEIMKEIIAKQMHL